MLTGILKIAIVFSCIAYVCYILQRNKRLKGEVSELERLNSSLSDENARLLEQDKLLVKCVEDYKKDYHCVSKDMESLNNKHQKLTDRIVELEAPLRDLGSRSPKQKAYTTVLSLAKRLIDSGALMYHYPSEEENPTYVTLHVLRPTHPLKQVQDIPEGSLIDDLGKEKQNEH